jgi:hypothetical protein
MKKTFKEDLKDDLRPEYDFSSMRVVARGPKRKAPEETPKGIRKVAFCPHCGNKAPQKLLHTQYTEDRGWTTDDQEEIDLPVVYFTVVCETCNSILLYSSAGYTHEQEHFDKADLVYPTSGDLHNSVPESIKKIYSEAIRVKTVAPNAFAVQIRRALEALCEDRQAKKGVLQKRLQDLAERSEIPPTLARMTDVLRLLGNVGAHAATEDVKPWQVYTLDEFFRAVVEYVYVAPSKLKDFQDSLKLFKNKVLEQSSTIP